MRRALLVLLAVLALGCRRRRVEPHAIATPPTPLGDVEIVVLGTAQDGGLPHVGCHAAPCERARRDASFRRLVVSLGIVDRRADRRFLVEATPDLPLQLDRLDLVAGGARPRGQNSVDGVLLTHAHIGHYTGLVHFGREVSATRNLPVYASERMLGFLQGAGPWKLLFDFGHASPHILPADLAVALTDRVRVTAIVVPHRDELSDTVAFRIEGPTRKLLFLPDIDRWEKWPRRIEDEVAAVDIALLDATFYGANEVPGRNAAEIPHPLVTDTLARLGALAKSKRIVLVHLNHSNPIADPASPEATVVRASGLEVGQDGMRFAL